MKTKLIVILAALINPLFLQADHHEKGDTRPATREDFIRYTKAVQGMWKGEVLSVIGDSSLGRTGDSYTAYWNSFKKSPSYSTSSFNGGRSLTMVSPSTMQILKKLCLLVRAMTER